eukprot:TRINITY_DN75451_c0_g1_i1.p1 TRINITY_DN75451_c0_g1~~TRINITY_DN75451_c0_g1_i1.p1  ORF type:complete len:425 (+),score=63.80 TRINITY_DN75451_c0_g1_i1:32-1276(+)
MCFRDFAIEADCPPETLAGIFSAVLVSVCILSCTASWTCLYYQWKKYQTNFGAIILQSETGDQHNVNFKIYELEDSGRLPAEAGSLPVLEILGGQADKSHCSFEKSTHIVWNPGLIEGGPLESFGQLEAGHSPKCEWQSPVPPRVEKVASSNLSLTNGPDEAKPSAIAPLPKTPSQWRGAQKGLLDVLDLEMKDLGSMKQSGAQDAWPIGASIEYFSASNSVWLPGRIASAGVFGQAEFPSYTVRLAGSGQERYHVPMSLLRPRLLDGEHVRIYYTDNHSSEWGNAVVRGTNLSRFGYNVEVIDGKYRSPAYFKQNMAHIRRRFPAGAAVFAYRGPGAGWVTGCVVEDAVENGATPGAKKEEGEEAVDPEVKVRVIMSPPSRMDGEDDGSPTQAEEEMTMPSGCLRFAGDLSKV